METRVAKKQDSSANNDKDDNKRRLARMEMDKDLSGLNVVEWMNVARRVVLYS